MGKTLKNILEKAIDSSKFVSVVLGTMAITGISLISLIEKENPLKTTKRLLNYFIPKIEIQSNTLKLNKNDFTYYVTNKNEEWGINDIKKIINASNYEERWLYLPEKQKWFEIGVNSYVKEKESGASTYKEDIKRILEKNKDVKELIFYHNHPSLEMTSLESPSIADIRTMVSEVLYFPNYKIKQKICSKEGITEYFLTEKAIKEFSSKDSIKLENYYSFRTDSSIMFNPEYFTLTFKPFEEKK